MHLLAASVKSDAILLIHELPGLRHDASLPAVEPQSEAGGYIRKCAPAKAADREFAIGEKLSEYPG